MAEHTERLCAADLIQAIKLAGIRFIVALPDRTTSEHLLKPLLADPELRVVQICKENEGVSICSGLYAAEGQAVLVRGPEILQGEIKNGISYHVIYPERSSFPNPRIGLQQPSRFRICQTVAT